MSWARMRFAPTAEATAFNEPSAGTTVPPMQLRGGTLNPKWVGDSSTAGRVVGVSDAADISVWWSPSFSPVVRLAEPPPADSAVTLQRWEGRVDEVGDESFVATLADLIMDGQEEVAEFALAEVSVADRRLVTPGAVFYWSVGWRDAVSGQRTRESLLRFRRLPRWTASAKRRAQERATEWQRDLDWSD